MRRSRAYRGRHERTRRVDPSCGGRRGRGRQGWVSARDVRSKVCATDARRDGHVRRDPTAGFYPRGGESSPAERAATPTVPGFTPTMSWHAEQVIATITDRDIAMAAYTQGRGAVGDAGPLRDVAVPVDRSAHHTGLRSGADDGRAPGPARPGRRRGAARDRRDHARRPRPKRVHAPVRSGGADRGGALFSGRARVDRRAFRRRICAVWRPGPGLRPTPDGRREGRGARARSRRRCPAGRARAHAPRSAGRPFRGR